MVCGSLVSAAIAVLLLVATAASEEQESARVVPIQQCPKQGLCPYVKRIIPEFFHHPTAYALTPAYPHYPHPHYPHPHPPPHYPQHYYPTHHYTSHHASPHHPPAPAPHQAERRDEPEHHHASHHAPTHHHSPHDHIEASLCGNLCIYDAACPGQKKCCPTECGYSCFDPVHLAD